MYRYLQETTAKKAKWKVVPDMAKFKGYFSECAMVTVLAVSEQREPTDSENPTQEIDMRITLIKPVQITQLGDPGSYVFG